jgi:hypothetical protein
MENNSVGLKSGALSFRIVFPIGLLSNVNLLEQQFLKFIYRGNDNSSQKQLLQDGSIV